MRASKVKAIRRALREEIEKGSQYAWIAHPKLYANTRGEQMLKFTFQYIVDGGLKWIKFAKKVYRRRGILPRKQNGRV